MMTATFAPRCFDSVTKAMSSLSESTPVRKMMASGLKFSTRRCAFSGDNPSATASTTASS